MGLPSGTYFCESTPITDHTFVFADIAGFTAASDIHGDETAADLSAALVAAARTALAADGRLVKTLGAAVLCAAPNPTSAIRFVEDLVEKTQEITLFPLLRIGLHHGPAIERDGDFFGTSVNIAARVTALAAPGQILATAGVADVAAALDIATTSLGQFSLRNLRDEFELFELTTGRSLHGHAIDPVCRMLVERDYAVGRLRHDSVEYWFCSLDCVERFAAAPHVYVQ